MYQNKSILKSKKFQYAVVFLAVAAVLVFLPTVVKLNSETTHLLNKLLSADIFIGSLVIGGHSLTDAVAQYANRPAFKELVSDVVNIADAAGLDEETKAIITDFLRENDVTF